MIESIYPYNSYITFTVTWIFLIMKLFNKLVVENKFSVKAILTWIVGNFSVSES